MRPRKMRLFHLWNPFVCEQVVTATRARIDADLLTAGLYTCQLYPYTLQELTPRLLPAITGLVWNCGGTTVLIPIEEQVTDRIEVG